MSEEVFWWNEIPPAPFEIDMSDPATRALIEAANEVFNEVPFLTGDTYGNEPNEILRGMSFKPLTGNDGRWSPPTLED